MRLRAVLFAGAALGLSGYAAWHAAQFATEYLETRDQSRVTELLAKAGEEWIGVEADGLLIRLSGEAPDEASRFRAVEVVRQAIDTDRIVDETGVVSPEPLEPPKFALELLRNDGDVSLIGLVPEKTARNVATSRVISDELARSDLGLGLTDMLETADYPAPEGWAESLAYALQVLASLPRAKISVEPSRVHVIAVADSAETKAFMERRLRSEQPESITLTLGISAPRPVITPFRAAYVLSGTTGRLEACSAEDDEAAATILAAARDAGLEQKPNCQIGLGSPSADWPEAVAGGIAALAELGGGRFEITDTTARLEGEAGTEPEVFKKVARSLDDALPDTYSLEIVAPPPAEQPGEAQQEETTVFVAVLTEDGNVTLEGAVRDETSKQAIHSYASALFGHDRIVDETVVDETVPEGWPARVLSGIDALHQTQEGRLAVTPGGIVVDGWGLLPDIGETVEEMLKDRGERVTVNVRFNAEAAAAEAKAEELAAMSQPEICAEEIGAILEAQSIQFRPGSADISPESRGVIAAIADVLRSCPGAQLEVAGHTDSQGREETNRALSTKRAEAVKAALEAQQLPLIIFRARGYGAEYPVAENDTEAGRRLNRRIELTLFEDSPAGAEIAGGLSPAECAARVNDVLGQDAIEFDVGASAISPSSQPVISALAETLRQCNGTRFEVGGYTDSLGEAGVNLRISAERAKAVLDALEAEGLPETVTLTSRGYGAENPIADNSTQEGRALNRRIEMHLLTSGEEGGGNAGEGATPVTATASSRGDGSPKQAAEQANGSE